MPLYPAIDGDYVADTIPHITIVVVQKQVMLNMSERSEIIFMQVRIIRLASEEWHMTIDKVMEIFSRFNILSYIEAGYGIFHCEGDAAVLDAITDLLNSKGLILND